MKIGFDAKRAFTNASGLGNYSRFTINSLIELFPTDEYVLYTPRQHDLFRNFFPEIGSVEIIEPEGNWKKLSSVWRVLKLAATTTKHHLDIFHGLSNELPINIQNHVPKAIVTIHDLIYLRYPKLFKPIDRKIYHNKFQSACRNSHHIVAISEQTKRDIVEFYKTDPAKIDVIYQDCNQVFHNACDQTILDKVKHKYQLSDRYLLCVGTLEPRKNQLNLLKAWHKAETDLEIVFIGKQTKYASQLKEYIYKHKLEDKVRFMSYIPFQELPAFYQLATIFAYPSIFEGFGIPILEALNSKVPVITSTGSCFSEAGGEGTLYVNPYQVEELASAIDKVTQQEELRIQMIELGYAHAQKFRPEQTISQLHTLYQKVLAS